MKLNTTLLAGLLLGATIFTMAEGEVEVDINVLITEAKNAAPEERFELINKIKIQISTMNEAERSAALSEMQASRDAMRETRASQFSGELTEDKIAEIKENMTDEQIEAFDARMAEREEYFSTMGPPSEEKIAEIKSNMTVEQLEVFEQRIQSYQVEHNRPNVVGRPDNIPEELTRPNIVGQR